MQDKNLILLENPIIEEKRDFQDLNSAEIAKINLLKIIISIKLTMINQEEKRDLGLKSTVGEVKIEPFKQCQKDIVENHLKIKAQWENLN